MKALGIAGLIALGAGFALPARAQTDATDTVSQPSVGKLALTHAAPPIDQPAVDARLAHLRIRYSDPGERAAFILKAKTRLEQSKSRLFERLSKTPPEKIEQLKILLAERELALHLAPLPAPAGGDASGSDPFRQVLAESEAQVRALLGEEDYAKFAAYQESEPYRETIERIVSAMRERGASVTAQQQEAILDAYGDALYAAAQASARDVTPADYTAMTTAERSALRAQQLMRFDEYLAVTMERVLEPADFKLFMEVELSKEAGGR